MAVSASSDDSYVQQGLRFQEIDEIGKSDVLDHLTTAPIERSRKAGLSVRKDSAVHTPGLGETSTGGTAVSTTGSPAATGFRGKIASPAVARFPQR